MHSIPTCHTDRVPLSLSLGEASGCILDQLEKVCEGEAPELVAPAAEENLWMCCCPEPYVPCSPNESDTTCAPRHPVTTRERGRRSAPISTAPVPRLLDAATASCGDLVRATAPAKCGEWPKAMPKLMCEMLTWQWEELGDGNAAEFAQYDCPMIQENQATGGDERKGHRLNWDPRRSREL
ncbi:unnamed protein product [Durusdinium trenchii]|uniref:Uncharacterized protein n=1 Tax=Durusdinium trenchii TaxID=1381693 RepID=A0ABP0M3T6_9DINO